MDEEIKWGVLFYCNIARLCTYNKNDVCIFDSPSFQGAHHLIFGQTRAQRREHSNWGKAENAKDCPRGDSSDDI